MNLIEIATHVQNQLDQATARIGEIAAEHATAITAKDAEIAACKIAYSEIEAYKSAMESKVGTVLQSGDPAQYEALAKEFLTPAEERERQEKLARIAKLEAEAAALKEQV